MNRYRFTYEYTAEDGSRQQKRRPLRAKTLEAAVDKFWQNCKRTDPKIINIEQHISFAEDTKKDIEQAGKNFGMLLAAFTKEQEQEQEEYWW